MKNWARPTLVKLNNNKVQGDGNPSFTYEDVCLSSGCVTSAGCIVTTAGVQGCTGSLMTYATGVADNGMTCVNAAGTAASAIPNCS